MILDDTTLTTAAWIEGLKAYWRASGALADFESQYKGEFEKQAHKDFAALEKTAKTFLAAWNEDVPEGQTAIVQCSRAEDDKICELYFAAGDAGDADGRCKACAAVWKDLQSWNEERR